MKNQKYKFYKFRVNHDGGTSMITVPAVSLDSAYRTLERAEHCPRNALEYLDKGS